ncbi:hypothetical protein TrLO_g15353 [Triparma laevis f. longispina]|uniref:Uncharacterized protein n=1 Tax=Triparma laevis f. longispina TaxID=1714387 RepID=A0A9W7FDA5_9STRA|nr:hypothetical protein TrLO_g15353 [Triparma laevis f. longispina]
MSTPSFSSDLLLLHTLLSFPPSGLLTESPTPPTPPFQTSGTSSPDFTNDTPTLETTLLLSAASLSLLPLSPSYQKEQLAPINMSIIEDLRKTSIVRSDLTGMKLKKELGEEWLEKMVKENEGMDCKVFLRHVYDKVYKF